MRASWTLIWAMVVFGLVATAARAEVRLVMFDQPGCVYCQQWEREVGDAYALTKEGQAAPLWRIGLRDTLPASISLDRPAAFTPTFVLLDADHNEVARIEGYPGEDFFWGLLAGMLSQLPQTESDAYE